MHVTFQAPAPLHCAANRGHAGVAKVLIENGAQINITNVCLIEWLSIGDDDVCLICH